MTFSLRIPLCEQQTMMLTNKRHLQLESSMLAKYSAGNVTVTTKEGLPVFVNLNVFFSSRYLASLLDLPPCVSAGLIIPDADLATLNILVKLLSGETVRDKCSTDAVQVLAKALGFNMSLTVTEERADPHRPTRNGDNLHQNDEAQSPRRKKRRTFDTAFSSLMQQESPTIR